MLMRVNPDRDLIRLCKKTVEALKADLAALMVKEDAATSFSREKPAYPFEAAKWYPFKPEASASELRRHFKSEWWAKDASPSTRAKIRDHIKAVVDWERRVDDLRKATGLHAAEIHENRTSRRAFDLMDRLLETPATTIYGAAHKAAVVHAWIDGGYGLDGRGEQLTLAILDEVRLLGTGGNNGGQIRVSHGIASVERDAPEMADAA